MLLYCRLSANDRSKLYLVFELVLEIRNQGHGYGRMIFKVQDSNICGSFGLMKISEVNDSDSTDWTPGSFVITLQVTRRKF